jgi:hypothetical protein
VDDIVRAGNLTQDALGLTPDEHATFLRNLTAIRANYARDMAMYVPRQRAAQDAIAQIVGPQPDDVNENLENNASVAARRIRADWNGRVGLLKFLLKTANEGQRNMRIQQDFMRFFRPGPAPNNNAAEAERKAYANKVVALEEMKAKVRKFSADVGGTVGDFPNPFAGRRSPQLTAVLEKMPKFALKFIKVLDEKQARLLEPVAGRIQEAFDVKQRALLAEVAEAQQTLAGKRRELDLARQGAQQEAAVQRRVDAEITQATNRQQSWDALQRRLETYMGPARADFNPDYMRTHFTAKPYDPEWFCADCGGAKRAAAPEACNYIAKEDEPVGAHDCRGQHGRHAVFGFTGLCLVCGGPTSFRAGHEHIDLHDLRTRGPTVYTFNILHGDTDSTHQGNIKCLEAGGGGIWEATARLLAFREYAKEKIAEAYAAGRPTFDLTFPEMARKAHQYATIVRDSRQRRGVQDAALVARVNALVDRAHRSQLRDGVPFAWTAAEEILPPRPAIPDRAQLTARVRAEMGVAPGGGAAPGPAPGGGGGAVLPVAPGPAPGGGGAVLPVAPGGGGGGAVNGNNDDELQQAILASIANAPVGPPAGGGAAAGGAGGGGGFQFGAPAPAPADPGFIGRLLGGLGGLFGYGGANAIPPAAAAAGGGGGGAAAPQQFQGLARDPRAALRGGTRRHSVRHTQTRRR